MSVAGDCVSLDPDTSLGSTHSQEHVAHMIDSAWQLPDYISER